MIPPYELRKSRQEAIKEKWQICAPEVPCYHCQYQFEMASGEEIGDARLVRRGVRWSGNGHSEFLVCSLHYIRERREREWERISHLLEFLTIITRLSDLI